MKAISVSLIFFKMSDTVHDILARLSITAGNEQLHILSLRELRSIFFAAKGRERYYLIKPFFLVGNINGLCPAAYVQFFINVRCVLAHGKRRNK